MQTNGQHPACLGETGEKYVGSRREVQRESSAVVSIRLVGNQI